jgi:hypothetical protein
MQTSKNGFRVTSAKRNSAVVFLILLLTAIIAICPPSLAQQAITSSSATTTASESVPARYDKSAETIAPRRVLVRSTALLVRAAVVEDKLLKRPEFKQLGFSITRDEADADLILELRHDLFTKYVFSVVEVKTHTVLASGKVSSLGGTVAGKVAKHFVKEMASMP